jgi:undecaprenyl phosphate-alpha-L-ara4N flippase subunit ArnE
MWLLHWIPWFVLSAILESCGQVSFKKSALSTQHLSGFLYFKGLAKSHYLYLGIALYIGEMAIWLYIISQIPLSIAFPLSGLQEMILVLFVAAALKEKVPPLAWCGVLLIAIGVSMVS